MNKRKTIYRGFNKRRKKKTLRLILIMIPVISIGTFGVIKLKNSDIVKSIDEKISFFKSINIKEDKFKGFEDFGIKEVSEENNKEEVEKKVEKEEDENVEGDVKVAIADSWSLYTIQVASIDNENEMNKIEIKLNESNLPFSVIEVDGIKKVQTYSSFSKDSLRNNIDSVKKVFDDAFISELKVPVLSMKYTSKYSYLGELSKFLNELVSNFKLESEFWDKNNENIDVKEYKKILTDRKNIVDNMKKEADKIDYKPADLFKENLIKYVDGLDEKINISMESIDKGEYSMVKSLYLSSMQGYYKFITSISKA
ncbi:hypothetical protein [Romboutsia sp. 1001713B170131_170501_G6]|uniref:hypothetical protein n=1 Tax=Romboutsia sp. 1001713B170131_170501_G6 TaxID=2787108 RepID=UPI0018A9D0A6|nr:hypothetical protein [Romboutsia sp. 1001713B170131_170501_G6]